MSLKRNAIGHFKHKWCWWFFDVSQVIKLFIWSRTDFVVLISHAISICYTSLSVRVCSNSLPFWWKEYKETSLNLQVKSLRISWLCYNFLTEHQHLEIFWSKRQTGCIDRLLILRPADRSTILELIF